MKFKLFKFTTLLFVTCAFLSCSSNGLDDNRFNQKEDNELVGNESILGKWDKIAEGIREDLIHPTSDDGIYFEYLPDGTYRIWVPDHYETGQTWETGRFYWKGTYKIYPDSLVCRTSPVDNSYLTEICYKYSFNEDTLHLFALRNSDIDYDSLADYYDPQYEGPRPDINLPRYFIFKRLKK